MPIEGPLKELGIQDVLQMLDLSQKTGVLTVRSQRMMDEAVVHILKGELVFASRRRSMRLLGQQLLRAGKLTEAELEQALEQQRKDPKQRLGAILLEMGSVDPKELDRQLRFQIEETIYDLLGWDEGYFRFEETEDTPEGPIRVRVESLLMEGARRLDEWSRLEARIPSPDCVPVLALPDASDSPLDLRPAEWEVLAQIDGERDLRYVASELGRSAFDVAKVAYRLSSLGLIRIRDDDAPIPDVGLEGQLDELERMLKRGDLDAAERRARELEEANPRRRELPMIAGRALSRQGRLQAAAESFDRAVALDPLSEEAHYHLGLAAVRAGDLERATEAWTAFLRLTGGGNHGGSRRRNVERAVAAMAELRRAMESAPTE